jgi:hypothetical protein
VKHAAASGRRPSTRPWILATALVAACLLPTDEGSGFGELRVMPAFDAGSEPDATGAEIDSVHTVVRRPGDDSGPVVDQVRPYRGPADVLTWLIQLRASSEDMDVEMELRAGTRTLYRGGRAVVVRNGSLGTDAIQLIAVAYMGTALPGRIEISPPSAAFTGVGMSRQLDAAVYAVDGTSLPGHPLDWSSADENVVTVDQTGRITSTGFGTALVVAAADGVADTASVVVDATLAQHATISAEPTTMPANGSATSLITVEVLDADGAAIGASAGVVTLTTDLGQIGLVTDHDDGIYTATLTAGTTAGTAIVTGTLTVKPSRITVGGRAAGRTRRRAP